MPLTDTFVRQVKPSPAATNTPTAAGVFKLHAGGLIVGRRLVENVSSPLAVQ